MTDPRLQDYRGPVHVWSNAAVGVDCLRVHGNHFAATGDDGSGRVQQVERHYVLHGLTVLHLIAGMDYILVSDALRGVLEQCCIDCVRFEPAIVTDTPTGRRVLGYTELRLRDEITEDTIDCIDVSGSRAWHFRRANLFVSKPVMIAMVSANIRGLVFSPGFTDFLGGSTAG